MSKRNQSWTVVYEVKTDFIQDYCDRGKRPQYGTKLNSEFSMGRWEFVVKEQG